MDKGCSLHPARSRDPRRKHPLPNLNSTQSGFVLLCSPASLHICSEHTACPPKTTYRGNHREAKQEEKYPKREFVQEKKKGDRCRATRHGWR